MKTLTTLTTGITLAVTVYATFLFGWSGDPNLLLAMAFAGITL